MIEKIALAVGALALIFGTVSQPQIAKGVISTCSYVCCDHDGDMWDN